MEKVLMLASVSSMIYQFNMPNIRLLLKQGYEVHVAANFEQGSPTSKENVNEFKQELAQLGVIYHQVDCKRGAGDLTSHIHSFRQIRKLLLTHHFSFIHCHTPITGALTRIAARKMGVPVIYTAHGFHFFDGAPMKNWLFYPIERVLSKYTDVLVTINQEDFNRANQDFKMKNIQYIPGVGLNTSAFRDVIVDKKQVRSEIGIPEDAILMFSVGEVTSRKNHETAIRALAKAENKKLYYIICGQGKLEAHLKHLSKELGIEERVLLLGFRKDIAQLCKSSDIYVFPSQREGLGIAAIEGMASGLPLISSYVNGIRDYTRNEETGFCLDPFDVEGFAKAMDKLGGDSDLRHIIGKKNSEAAKRFDIKNVNNLMEHIYLEMSYTTAPKTELLMNKEQIKIE